MVAELALFCSVSGRNCRWDCFPGAPGLAMTGLDSRLRGNDRVVTEVEDGV